MKAINFNPTDKVCILRSAFLGDWITIIPFINYLLEDCGLEKENIFFLIMNKGAVNPAAIILGKESIYAKNTFVLNSASSSLLLESAKFAKNSINKKIDKLIHLSFTHDSRSSLFKKRMLSKYIFSSSVKKIGFSYDVKAFIPESQYVSYFKKLGINDDKSPIKLSNFYTKNNSETFNRLTIAVYPNSKLAMKIWPIEKYKELIIKLNQLNNYNFYLIGGKEDIDYNNALIISLANENIDIKNIAGEKNISETISFLDSIDLLIANDGAPIHFAALVNTPTLGLFTYKEPVGAWEPFINNHFITIRNEVSCKICFKEFCPNPVCIKHIEVDIALAACKELLAAGRLTSIRNARVNTPKKIINYLSKHGN